MLWRLCCLSEFESKWLCQIGSRRLDYFTMGCRVPAQMTKGTRNGTASETNPEREQPEGSWIGVLGVRASMSRARFEAVQA